MRINLPTVEAVVFPDKKSIRVNRTAKSNNDGVVGKVVDTFDVRRVGQDQVEAGRSFLFQVAFDAAVDDLSQKFAVDQVFLDKGGMQAVFFHEDSTFRPAAEGFEAEGACSGIKIQNLGPWNPLPQT